MKIVTTFSLDGYELYGKRMINTWLQYWPSNAELIIYTEDFKIHEQDSRLKEIDIFKACPNLKQFKEKSEKIKVNCQKETNRIKKAIRWSHKVYVISHALNLNCDCFLFLDGDTYTTNKINDNLIKDLLQNHLIAVHFEQIKNDLHFETGAIAFNLKHSQTQLLKDKLQSGYDNLEIYSLQKPWDGFWFSYLYKKYNLDVLNLGYGKVFSNPLINGKLHHNVGKKKFNNNSIEYDKYSGRKKK